VPIGVLLHALRNRLVHYKVAVVESSDLVDQEQVAKGWVTAGSYQDYSSAIEKGDHARVTLDQAVRAVSSVRSLANALKGLDPSADINWLELR